MISLGATVRAIANTKSAALAEYIGVSSLKPFINSELVLAEAIEFNIPGTQFHQVIGISKTCETMDELREKVAHYYNKQPMQLAMHIPPIEND